MLRQVQVWRPSFGPPVGLALSAAKAARPAQNVIRTAVRKKRVRRIRGEASRTVQFRARAMQALRRAKFIRSVEAPRNSKPRRPKPQSTLRNANSDERRL